MFSIDNVGKYNDGEIIFLPEKAYEKHLLEYLNHNLLLNKNIKMNRQKKWLTSYTYQNKSYLNEEI